MWQYNHSDTLYHHGIKGQKWGIRRFQKKNGSLTSAGKKRYDNDADSHNDYKKAHSGTNVKTMSDQELRNQLNRLQMEKQYSQLTSREKSAGEKFVKNALMNAANQVATQYISKYMNKGVEAIIKKISRSS